MASTAAVSGLQSLIIFVVMGLVTLWFTNLMFRALDILYKPGVKKWIQDRPSLDFPDLDPELCPLNPQGQQSEACQNGKSKKQASKGGSGKKDMPLSFAGKPLK